MVWNFNDIGSLSAGMRAALIAAISTADEIASVADPGTVAINPATRFTTWTTGGSLGIEAATLANHATNEPFEKTICIVYANPADIPQLQIASAIGPDTLTVAYDNGGGQNSSGAATLKVLWRKKTAAGAWGWQITMGGDIFLNGRDLNTNGGHVHTNGGLIDTQGGEISTLHLNVTGNTFLTGLATSDPAQAGMLWSDADTIKVSTP